ncbi:hypothetical protein OB13_09385 [Pontibacter sp. HJ8]
MKTGIASFIVGMAGLIVITYFNFQANLSYQAAEESENMINLYSMSQSTRATLFVFETVGVVLGVLSFQRYKSKVGLLGMGISTLCLILLYNLF